MFGSQGRPYTVSAGIVKEPVSFFHCLWLKLHDGAACFMFKLTPEGWLISRLSSLAFLRNIIHRNAHRLCSPKYIKHRLFYATRRRCIRLRWLFSFFFPLWQWPMRLWSGCDGRLSSDKQKVSVVDEGVRPAGPLM